MFEALRELADKVKSIDENEVLKEVWEQEDVQEFIIDLNTTKQLFRKAVDSEGENLGGYSKYTVKLKKEKGLPWDHITLYDDGDFYSSFTIKPNNKGFIIEANTDKGDGDLISRYGKDILGLTSESKDELINFVLKRIIDEIKYRLLRL